MTPTATLTGHRILASTVIFKSQVRANIAAMSSDVINAGLWALAAFDPALVHFAELRERNSHLEEEDVRRVSLDRALSVYLEGQCSELLQSAGITRHELDQLIDERIGDTTTVMYNMLACNRDEDPLTVEIFGYGLHLGVLTGHGQAPWNRYSAVIADCFRHKYPKAKVAA